MHKYFKSIVAIMLIVVTLIIINVPAMAAKTETMQNPVIAMQSEVCIGNGEGTATYSGSTVKVATIWLQGSATLLKHRITGPSNQWVNVRLVHQQTGETRNFTGISSGSWLSDTYYSSMRSGYWDFYIVGAGEHGKYTVQINAYFVG